VAQVAEVFVETASSFFTVDERYVSVTVEGCEAVIKDQINLTSPILRQLTKNLAPAYLRFGGSCNDCVRYDVGGKAPLRFTRPESKVATGDRIRLPRRTLTLLC
jgi:hypothetical protein